MEKGTERKIILTIDSKGECSMHTEGEVSLTELIQLCLGAINHAAEQTVAVALQEHDMQKIEDPENIKREGYAQYVRQSIADTINFAASNLLNHFCPPDPDMQLSEVAIATMENEIIQKAAREGIPLKDALEQYQNNLLESSPYAANKKEGKVIDMACKKKGKGKGKGGSC